MCHGLRRHRAGPFTGTAVDYRATFVVDGGFGCGDNRESEGALGLTGLELSVLVGRKNLRGRLLSTIPFYRKFKQAQEGCTVGKWLSILAEKQ
jgi:hypothetical protein